ncbi:uncharacterized protein [Rhodnius prolixus]|uniref:uncharacterized protein n=1 Tax=Rhodnius prolixus TaxID=13249 RepID=UPI003D189D63
MLIFVALILGVSASSAAEPNGNQKCIEKCVHSTTCAPTQEHHQNCSDKEQYEKCISTCTTSNTENLKKTFLDEHKNSSNATGLVQNHSTNQRNLYAEKMDIYKKLSKNDKFPKKFVKVEANGTLMNSQHYNESIDRQRNRYIMKKIIGTIKNRISAGLSNLVDILDTLSTNSSDNDKFKANNGSFNENKLKAIVHILEALKKHLPEAENRKVKRDTALSNLGRKVGGYIGENVGRLAARKRMPQGGLTGRMFNKIGAYTGRTVGQRMGKKMADKVANIPSNVLKSLGVFSNQPAYPEMESDLPMKKFCCAQC